jgi:prepilin-type N-terminal cleavage/methylation domain-containing protein
MSRHRIRGLTVLEMLVALAIVSMAMMLGMQGLMQWTRAQERFGATERIARETMLSEAWVRRALATRLARPDRGEDGSLRDALRGNAREMSLVSLSPILGSQGIARRQTWRIVSEAGASWLVVDDVHRLRLPSGCGCSFIYIDNAGRTHDRWPAERLASDTFPVLVGLITPESPWIAASSLRPVTVPYEPPPD